jgi:hypothetical protein
LQSVDPETAWAYTKVGVADKRTLSLSHKSVLMGNVNLTNFKGLLERHGVQVGPFIDDSTPFMSFLILMFSLRMSMNFPFFFLDMLVLDKNR